MGGTSLNLENLSIYLKTFIKMILIALAVGIIGGLTGSVFHICLDSVTNLRRSNNWIIFFLPLGGILITAMYQLFKNKGKMDTNRVIDSIRENEKIPLVMIPLIFISTVITHMLGGSAGREGAALQIGGGIGYNFGKALRLKENDMHIIVMAGMSAVFAALFGTPLTAAIFSLEVTTVGILNYAALLPCVISSITACSIAGAFGLSPVYFGSVLFETISAEIAIKVIFLGLIFSLISIIFCMSISRCEHYMNKFIKNCYLRAFTGGAIIVALTFAIGTFDYNGAGMDVINRAISGNAKPEAFILKILFTAITISAGFRGGEIVPSFFIGSTLGCIMAPVVNLDAGFCAALGFVALFCAVVNCPLASILLSIEVFGTDGILYFAIICSISYMMSGNYGIYKSQRISYSKADARYIDIKTK